MHYTIPQIDIDIDSDINFFDATNATIALYGKPANNITELN